MKAFNLLSIETVAWNLQFKD